MKNLECAITAADLLSGMPAATQLVIGQIASERHRQIEVEGYTPEHDDGERSGELAWAAAYYALSAHPVTAIDNHVDWPFDAASCKPTCTRVDLVKAAALLVAEIERRDRAAAKGDAF